MFDALSDSKSPLGHRNAVLAGEGEKTQRWDTTVCSAGKVFSIATEAEHMSPWTQIHLYLLSHVILK